MPTFRYTAVTSSGQRDAGLIDAETSQLAVDALYKRGLLALDVLAADASGATAGVALKPAGRRPSSTDVTLFTRELGLLLGSGMSLSHALSAVEAGTDSHRIQGVAQRLRQSIGGGKSLTDALFAEGDAFSPIYVGMVRAAEASGTLARALGRIADTREQDQKLRAKITSALLYPSLLILTAIATVVLLFTVVIPRISQSLGESALAQLPSSSKAVFALSDWLLAWGEWLAIGVILAILTGLLLWRRPAVQRFWQRAVLRLPIIGNLVRTAQTARFCRTLGLLLSSGLQLPVALQLTRGVMSFEDVRTLIDRLGIALRQGEDFAIPLGQSRFFPSLVGSMLRTGAESGLLAQSAERLADMYESKLDIGLQRFVTVLEPTIILLISGFIALVVVSIMSAIMGIYDLTGTQL